jgi:hypothetical protein
MGEPECPLDGVTSKKEQVIGVIKGAWFESKQEKQATSRIKRWKRRCVHPSHPRFLGSRESRKCRERKCSWLREVWQSRV